MIDSGNQQTVNFLGLTIDNLTSEAALDALQDLTEHRRKNMVCFVNAHCVNVAYKDFEYRQSLLRASMVLADGSGVLLGSRIMHTPICENLNGTDLIPKLCAAGDKRGYTLFLLGGHEGVAEAAANNLVLRFPGLRIAGTHHGYFSETETDQVVDEINRQKPDILLVALGVPMQEKWIATNLHRLDVGTCFAVGGLFDFLSQRIPRAPEWVRRTGLEWVFRLLMEPRRMWKRYLIGNSLFLARIGRARLFKAAGKQVSLKPLSGYGKAAR